MVPSRFIIQQQQQQMSLCKAEVRPFFFFYESNLLKIFFSLRTIHVKSACFFLPMDGFILFGSVFTKQQQNKLQKHRLLPAT